MRAFRSLVSGLAAVGLVLIAGCGGSSGDETDAALTPQEVIAQAKPGTVELFGKVGDDLVGGTGFVYDAEQGLIITNAHVVEGVSQLQAKVGDTLPTVPARVVGQSPCDDLAVVSLVQKPDGLGELPLGDSNTVRNGDDVVALGYPASFQRARQQQVSSTEGSVSNPDVVGNQIGIDLPKYPALIEHAAAINHGNSGGPLLNTKGEVVGVNALSSAPIGNQGQYYAITVNQAKNVIPTLESGQSPGLIGWSLVPLSLVNPADLARDLSAHYDLPVNRDILNVAKDATTGYKGLYVVGSPQGSLANKSDIYAGDLITAINGTSVQTIPQLCKILQSAQPGASLAIDEKILASGKNTDDYGGSYSTTLKLPTPAPPSGTTTDATASSTTTSDTAP